MGSFFKSFGKGILYILTLPVVLVVLVLYASVGLIAFVFLMIKSVVLFFKGKTIFSELPEDVKAREILNPTPKDTVEVVEPKEENPTGAFTQTYYQGAATVYPIGGEEPPKAKEIKFDEVKELETPQEIVNDEPPYEEEEEIYYEEEEDTSPFLEEPEISDELHLGDGDVDLDHFDIGAKRITKDEDE